MITWNSTHAASLWIFYDHLEACYHGKELIETLQFQLVNCLPLFLDFALHQFAFTIFLQVVWTAISMIIMSTNNAMHRALQSKFCTIIYKYVLHCDNCNLCDDSFFIPLD